MKTINRAILICLAVVIAALETCVVCFADDKIDIEKRGSVTFYVNDLETDAPITSGTFTIYRIAGLTENNGGYEFVLTDDFSAGKFDLSNSASARFANAAADYISKNNPQCFAVSTLSSSGILKFENLPTGIYIAVNTVAAAGYYPLNPFAFSIPDFENGKAIYDVIAKPKPEPMKPQDWPPPPPPYDPNYPDNPDNPDNPNNPDEPTDPDDPWDFEDFDNPDEWGDNGEDIDGPDSLPETGDRESLYMWFLGMAISASAALAAVIFYIKQKKQPRKGEKE